MRRHSERSFVLSERFPFDETIVDILAFDRLWNDDDLLEAATHVISCPKFDPECDVLGRRVERFVGRHAQEYALGLLTLLCTSRRELSLLRDRRSKGRT